MKGERVRIRPVKREDLEVLESWVNDIDTNSVFNDFGFQGHQSMEAAFEKTGMIDDHQAAIIVETLAGEIVGGMNYYQTILGPKTVHQVYGIGLHIAPEHRGKGYGTEAQVLLADYLFNTYPIARVEAGTDVENTAEQRSLEKAGFTREGVMRKAQWRRGEFHDLVLYSKLRGE
jgi:aminoglycoside 6'-N-acetyltransferase